MYRCGVECRVDRGRVGQCNADVGWGGWLLGPLIRIIPTVDIGGLHLIMGSIPTVNIHSTNPMGHSVIVYGL